MRFQESYQSATLRNLSKDKDDSFGALLTDLSKTFDCSSHELLITKLAAYGFSRYALKLMYT